VSAGAERQRDDVISGGAPVEGKIARLVDRRASQNPLRGLEEPFCQHRRIFDAPLWTSSRSPIRVARATPFASAA